MAAFFYIFNCAFCIVHCALCILNLLKFCQVLDGANHLAGVAVLVVVPANNLYLVGVVVDFANHSLSSIEEATKTHTDYVA